MTLTKHLLPTALAASLAATLLLAGCASGQPADGSGPAQAEAQPSAQQGGAVTFTDDTGAEVSVENPQRVVACMGSFANIWELAGGTLVGASDDAFDSYDIASADAQKVGDFSNPNLEAIIALEPDFVIMTSGSGGRGGDSNQADLKAALDASGIPVAFFEVTTFDDYLRMLKTCTDITGRADLYEQNGQKVADEIEAIKAKQEDLQKAFYAISEKVYKDAAAAGQAAGPDKQPSALLMTTFSGGTRVQSSSSMTGAMLADLGVRNLADENKSLLKDFSLESVIEMNPDFIFVVPMGNDDAAAMKNLEEATAANPAWSTLSAVQGNHYLTLDKELFLYKPNARWAESYQALYDALYA